jgi:hypothetical protein
MIKPYRYLIYKLYSWGLRKKGDTPVANVIITLSIVHFFQILLLYSVIGKFFPKIAIFDNIGKIYIGIFLVLFMIAHYFLLYNKKRWKGYLEEFKNESSQQNKKRKVFVLIYLIGSILMFFALMPVLFG